MGTIAKSTPLKWIMGALCLALVVFKIEFVFPLSAANNSNPMMNHYLVLYPAGTVNSMAGDPGRQW